MTAAAIRNCGMPAVLGAVIQNAHGVPCGTPCGKQNDPIVSRAT
jgi:hypothetical protein